MVESPIMWDVNHRRSRCRRRPSMRRSLMRNFAFGYLVGFMIGTQPLSTFATVKRLASAVDSTSRDALQHGPRGRSFQTLIESRGGGLVPGSSSC